MLTTSGDHIIPRWLFHLMYNRPSGYNYMWVMNNNQFRSLSEFYIIIFLNKLKVVENKNKKINIKKLKQRVGPFDHIIPRWSFHLMYNSGLCKLAQEQNLVDDHDLFMQINVKYTYNNLVLQKLVRTCTCCISIFGFFSSACSTIVLHVFSVSIW
jgi:hypothetical protein